MGKNLTAKPTDSVSKLRYEKKSFMNVRLLKLGLRVTAYGQLKKMFQVSRLNLNEGHFTAEQ
jgi:hypothetical protein